MKDNGTMTRSHHRRKNQESQSQIASGPPTVAMEASGVPSALDGLAIKLTHEEIARRAYQLYEDRGGEHGHDLQDWFQAERELREFLRDAAGKVLMAEGLYAAV